MNTNPKTQLPTPPEPSCLALSAPDPRPKWKQKLARLWPGRSLPNIDLPKWAKDALYIETEVRLSFPDRLRILVSGRLQVTSRTFTQNVPGRCTSASVAYTLPPLATEASDRPPGVPPRPIPPAPPRPLSPPSDPGLNYSIATDVVIAKQALDEACKAFDDAVREADPSKGHLGAAGQVAEHGSILGDLRDALNLILCQASLRSSAAKKLTPEERRAALLDPKIASIIGKKRP